MKTFIGILLVGLLGFSGCSSSDAESSPAYNVQAIGMVDGSGLSVYAFVTNQEEKLSTDVLITINGEPMNIGFFAAEDLNIDGEDSLTDHNSNLTVHGVPSGDWLPFYFSDSVDLNAGDTMSLSANGKYGTIYSSSAVVPEKVTLIEPSSDATFLPGQEVYLKWEGGDSSTCFQVLYSGGNEDASYASHWIKDQRDYIIPAGVLETGALSLMVSGRDCSQIQTDIDEPTLSSIVFEDFDILVSWVDDDVGQPQEPARGWAVDGPKTKQCNVNIVRRYNKCVNQCADHWNRNAKIRCAEGCMRQKLQGYRVCRAKFCHRTCD